VARENHGTSPIFTLRIRSGNVRGICAANGFTICLTTDADYNKVAAASRSRPWKPRRLGAKP